MLQQQQQHRTTNHNDKENKADYYQEFSIDLQVDKTAYKTI